MAVEIRVPTLGESVTEATIGKWLKQPGDAVKADETLVELLYHYWDHGIQGILCLGAHLHVGRNKV